MDVLNLQLHVHPPIINLVVLRDVALFILYFALPNAERILFYAILTNKLHILFISPLINKAPVDRKQDPANGASLLNWNVFNHKRTSVLLTLLHVWNTRYI